MNSVVNALAPKVYSNLADDPDLFPLVELFVAEIPQRVAALEEAGAAKDWAMLERLAHRIKGAAASYGFPQVTPLAANLERVTKEQASVDAIERCLEELVDFCNQMSPGQPAGL